MHQHKPGQHESPTSGLLVSALTDRPAYAYLYSTTDQTVAPLADVVFGDAGPSSQITAPPGTSFTILKTGDYQFNFETRGQPDAEGDVSVFAIFVNGLEKVGTRFASELIGGTPVLVVGSGIISLAAGDVVTLRSLTPSTVSFTAAVPTASEIAINASMDLIQIS